LIDLTKILNFIHPPYDPQVWLKVVASDGPNGNHDAILATTFKKSLGVSIGSLRLRMKCIQEEFNELSQEAWVKKVQIYQVRPLSTLWVIFESYK